MKPVSGDLQDGMLAYYLEQGKLSDATVEARIEREPFDICDILKAANDGRLSVNAARRIALLNSQSGAWRELHDDALASVQARIGTCRIWGVKLVKGEVLDAWPNHEPLRAPGAE